MKSEYIHSAHKVSKLMYHIVFPTKYRRIVISEKVDEVIVETCKGISDRYFRPLTTILICVIFPILISIPCAFFITHSTPDSIIFQASLAILTGVVASGLVSIAIEMANNYRRNYQRLLVLHEYLLFIALYRERMDSIQDCGIGEGRIAVAGLTVRDMTVVSGFEPFSAKNPGFDKAHGR